MQTQAPVATSTKVAAHLPAYTGPLGRFLQKQAETKAAAQAARLLHTMRANVMALMTEPHLFTPDEQLRANDSVYQCECVAQLQRWFRNVYRVYKERETALYLPFEDGTSVRLAVEQPAASLMWIA